ncbi:hypothetical protein [Xylophilus sp. Leaf220]|uniref:hypothetical protein n=1 Tax=Xylophilus sp. Leaf220 TaxID=1735686 RepID=UPI0006F5F0AE|nr:hypothetical protein [Xylophilus sp. Leaf220]KQM68796.1 hypothetical protein ASE76_13950 [Xylophilus sp. Leaf220]
MAELSYIDKMELPYTLLLDPVKRRAAAYNGRHMRITETASEQLVAYGLANTVKRVAYDPDIRRLAPDRHPVPAWATPEVLARAELLWIRTGGLTDAEWLAIPDR